MKINRCKGSRDFCPEEMVIFRFIEGLFRDYCLKWGYKEVRTPTLEYLHLFTSAGTLTPSLLSKVYSFLDWDGWGGERVVLRPDGTIPIARLYTESMANLAVAKLFYVTNVFVFEPSGKENREKWQCGAELIGGTSPLADVELISLASEILHKLGFQDIELKISHAGLIRAILAKLGLSSEESTAVFDKILDRDMSALAKIKEEKPEMGNVLPLLLDLKGKSPGFLKNLKSLFGRNLSELEPFLKDFISIVELLEAPGCRYQIDLASGRSFEYYTGVIFQLVVNDKLVGGGGRYDKLIPLVGGKNVPASGFALYLDQIMGLIKEVKIEPLPGVLVETGSDALALIKEGFGIARILRENGYMAQFRLDSNELSGIKWLLTIRERPPRFGLTSLAENKRFTAKTADEVLALLRAHG